MIAQVTAQRAEPPFTLRVGVTGHRNTRQQRVEGALRDRVRAVFALLWQTMVDAAPAGSAPNLIAVSLLAEGADRLIADEAIVNGFSLHCPLPFPRDIYERDFADAASRAEFRAILARAVAVQELPGAWEPKARRDAAYAAAGRVVVDESDVLIAIWDGEPARGTGGTTDVIEDALARPIPVVWIASQSAHAIHVLTREAQDVRKVDTLSALAGWVRVRMRRPA